MILPKGYKRVQYIQSDGTAYIDSGRAATDKTKIEVKAHGTFYSAITGTYRFGVYYVSGSNRLDIAFGSTGYLAGVISGINYPAITTLENGKAVCNGVEYVFAKQAAFTTSENLPLFGNNSAGACHYYKWQENGVLVREFVPCINDSGVVGMFDLVEQKFYGNAGGGNFNAGPVVPEQADESEIVELEWIESGGEQYIDSAFNPNQNTRVTADAQWTDTGTFNLFGSRTVNYNQRYAVLIADGAFRSDYAEANASFSGLDLGARHKIDKNKNICKIGSVSVTNTAATFQAAYSLYLFACNQGGAAKYFGAIRLWSMQIYDNGLLVRDYIPAKTIEGEVGLYDRVNSEFYRNAGTGEFIAGPETVKAPKAPANFRVVSESDTEVTLAWNASENAEGYLVRQSGMVIADTTELTVTAEIQPFGYYTFEVSAYNEYGEGDRSALAVFRTPDNPMLWLVTDRTVQDVMERSSKGVYQTVDLNRVSAAVNLLKDLLESAGFIVNVSPTLMWKDTEWVNVSQAAQHLANVKELRSKQAVLPTTPETPETLEKLNHTQANHIEQILLDVYTQYLIMLTTRVAVGTATSGGDYL